MTELPKTGNRRVDLAMQLIFDSTGMDPQKFLNLLIKSAIFIYINLLIFIQKFYASKTKDKLNIPKENLNNTINNTIEEAPVVASNNNKKLINNLENEITEEYTGVENHNLEDFWMNTNLMCISEKVSLVLNEIKWKKIFIFSPGEEEYLLYKI